MSLDTKVPGPGKDIYGRAMSYPDIQQLQALTQDFAGVAAYTYARYKTLGGRRITIQGEPSSKRRMENLGKEETPHRR